MESAFCRIAHGCMEDTIIKFEVIGNQDPKLLRFRAWVRCVRCGKPFTFDFTAENAGIAFAYKSDNIARAYAKRCAPVYCSVCL